MVSCEYYEGRGLLREIEDAGWYIVANLDLAASGHTFNFSTRLQRLRVEVVLKLNAHDVIVFYQAYEENFRLISL